MKKVAVIYWSGTGNTEAMAEAVAKGAKGEGVEVSLQSVSDATIADVTNADAVALGCPSMGLEVLEEAEMEPFVESLQGEIKDKPMVLFGSYGWGNGEWMEDWEVRMKSYGANLVADCLILNETPDAEGLNQCEALGKALK